MKVELTRHQYGKSSIRLTKVVRDTPIHQLFEIDAAISLEGDFDAAYLQGDNRHVVATDTIKNTVYVLGKKHRFESIEEFALILAKHFVNTYPQVAGAAVNLSQSSWRRIVADDTPHDHAFTLDGPQRRQASALDSRNGPVSLSGGVSGLQVIKTTASEWKDFHSDAYRTLKDTSDRILGTTIDASWIYNDLSGDFNRCYEAISGAILNTFATRHSLGAQHTIMAMGEAALAVCDRINQIDFTLPNQHRIPFNLDPFGLKFENDIFITTDEPYGLITGSIARRQ